eukprot:15444726-Alexandrium_andersonii.AAC.1
MAGKSPRHALASGAARNVGTRSPPYADVNALLLGSSPDLLCEAAGVSVAQGEQTALASEVLFWSPARQCP